MKTISLPRCPLARRHCSTRKNTDSCGYFLTSMIIVTFGLRFCRSIRYDSSGKAAGLTTTLVKSFFSPICQSEKVWICPCFSGEFMKKSSLVCARSLSRSVICAHWAIRVTVAERRRWGSVFIWRSVAAGGGGTRSKTKQIPSGPRSCSAGSWSSVGSRP